jgi:predicted transcriptional regulator
MFNNRRSEIEIVGEILKISQKGARKTEILYQGNLSYTQVQSYLPFLVKKNILEENLVKDNGNSYKEYKVTKKGLNLLEDINRILSHFNSVVL